MNQEDKDALALAFLSEDTRLYIGHHYLVAADGVIEVYLDWRNKSTYLGRRNTVAEAVQYVKQQQEL
jgi:hypothetical protein